MNSLQEKGEPKETALGFSRANPGLPTQVASTLALIQNT